MDSQDRNNTQGRAAPDDVDRTVRFWVRVRGAIVGTGCVLLILAAVFRLPSRVPMPPCSFQVNTGYPCPGCGMTRSMMAVAHGDVVEAFRCHPFGVALFAFVALCTLLGVAELITARDLFEKLKPSPWWVVVGIAAMLAGWGWKLLTGPPSG